MPKPSRGQSSKKPAPPLGSGEDTSFIVFSNSTKEPKAKKKDVGTSAAQPSDPKAKGKAQAPADPQKEEPKKPDTRTLIGGASWTGKLPLNMLAEHCQKKRWDKPEYTMV